MLDHLQLGLEPKILILAHIGGDPLPHNIVIESFAFLVDNSRSEFAHFDLEFSLPHGDVDHIIRRVRYANSPCHVVASASSHWTAFGAYLLFSTRGSRIEHLLIHILLVHLN